MLRGAVSEGPWSTVMNGRISGWGHGGSVQSVAFQPGLVQLVRYRKMPLVEQERERLEQRYSVGEWPLNWGVVELEQDFPNFIKPQ